jgi:hypothetical protein
MWAAQVELEDAAEIAGMDPNQLENQVSQAAE